MLLHFYSKVAYIEIGLEQFGNRDISVLETMGSKTSQLLVIGRREHVEGAGIGVMASGYRHPGRFLYVRQYMLCYDILKRAARFST